MQHSQELTDYLNFGKEVCTDIQELMGHYDAWLIKYRRDQMQQSNELWSKLSDADKRQIPEYAASVRKLHNRIYCGEMKDLRQAVDDHCKLLDSIRK